MRYCQGKAREFQLYAFVSAQKAKRCKKDIKRMHAKKLYTGMLGPSCQDSRPAAASLLPPVVVVAGAALLAPAVTIYCISAFEEYGWMHDNCLCSANSAKVVKTCHNSANWSPSRNLSHSTAILHHFLTTWNISSPAPAACLDSRALQHPSLKQQEMNWTNELHSHGEMHELR